MKNEKTKAVGVKYDQGKNRLDLVSTLAIEEMAWILTFGASKYKDHNWRFGMSWSRLIRAGIGHVFSFMRGEDNDHETGRSHLAHAMCCLMFLLEYQLTGNGIDDRWNEKNKLPHNASGRKIGKNKRKTKR
ncbi:hypothetical protein [Caudoviricetes sp.]|nr:hypothetical protein [Caudoviricetes sp.]UOF79127.1 hypothetical protein [Caudoviricetes sp.]